MSQLGMKGSLFVDTAVPNDFANIAPYSGLIAIYGSDESIKYVPLLDERAHSARTVPFDDWWTATVFVDSKNQRFSRQTLVLTAANQDGGAHVDPALDSQYEALSKKNAMGAWFANHAGIAPIANPERAAIRQIAHELLRTLKPGYSKIAVRDGLRVWGLKLTVGPLSDREAR